MATQNTGARGLSNPASRSEVGQVSTALVTHSAVSNVDDMVGLSYCDTALMAPEPPVETLYPTPRRDDALEKLCHSMTLYCPNDATALERVILDEHLPTEAVGHQCMECGGALLDTGAQRAVLGNGLSGGGGAPSRATCPRCNIKMQALEAGTLRLDGCVPCGHIWFDPGELVAVRALIRKLTGETESSTLDEIPLACADCGDPVDEPAVAAQAPIGLVCAVCHARPGFGTEAPALGERTHTYRQAQVTVRHVLGSTYHGEAHIEAEIRSPVRATLRTWSWWLRLWSKLGGAASVEDPALDAVYHVESATRDALRAFLRRPGVADMLLDFAGGTSSRVELGPDRLVVVVKGSHKLLSPTLLENHARWLFDAYRRFVRNGAAKRP